MANRQQDYQQRLRQHLQGWQRRPGGERSWEDEGRYRGERFSSRDEEDRDYGQREFGGQREYGQYANPEEGEGRGRAGGYDEEGRTRFDQWREMREEGGPTGRFAGSAGYGDFGQGDYEQGRFGQPNYEYGYGYGRAGRRDYIGAGRGAGGMASRLRQSRFGYGGPRQSGYGSGNWYEPYGEGQQYGSQYGEDPQYGRFGEGLHRGKGPKGYQRSDERLKEMICERLREDPDIDASDVTVTVMGGKITLDGSVDERRIKNAIEEIADQLGVQDVQNNLRIQRLAGRSGTGAGGSMGKSTLATDDEDQKRQKRN